VALIFIPHRQMPQPRPLAAVGVVS
jgi:hypothetical protein